MLEKDAISVRTYTREDYTGALRFLQRRGFVEAKRSWQSDLDLTGFDFTPYAGHPERVEAAGIRLGAPTAVAEPIPSDLL